MTFPIPPRLTDADIALLNAAARRFPDRLFIVPAGELNADLDHSPATKDAGAPNLIVVAAATPDGRISEGSNWGALSVDVATEAGAVTSFGAAGPRFSFKPEGDISMARLAALAARLLAIRPDLSAEELKRAVLRLAQPAPNAGNKKTRTGFIATPWRQFQVEKR